MCKAGTAYYEMYSMAQGHRIYKSVQLSVIKAHLFLKKEPGNPHSNLAHNVAILVVIACVHKIGRNYDYTRLFVYMLDSANW